jgi:ABC-2 type transport system permease protein
MSPAASMSNSRLWSAYFGEIGFEFIKALRTPQFAVPTLFFPIMFYVLFALAMGKVSGNSAASLYSFANYGVFGCMGPGLFGFGVALAIERELGLLTLKQALPSPPGAYLIARAVMAMLFVALITLMLMTLAVLFAHAPLTLGQAVKVFCVNVLGTLPFCAIGMFVGALVSGQAAVAICNLIFLPMSFLSGLWFPIQILPKFLVAIAPTWPAYHLSQLAMNAVGSPSAGSVASHVLVLAVITLLFFFLAMRRLQSGGFRLLGSSPRRTLIGATAIVALIAALTFSGVFGGKPATSEGAAAATAASSADTGTPASSAPASAEPKGVAAPAAALAFDFDAGSEKAPYGIGLLAVDDSNRGGNSKAAQQVVTGGAGGSKGALEVAGEIGNAIQYPFAGTMFFPEGPPMQGLMDYSGKKTLSFMARGDGKRYMVMISSGVSAQGIPFMYPFTTGTEWQEIRLNLADFSNIDLTRVRFIAIGIGPMGPAGPFKFQIDNVRLE